MSRPKPLSGFPELAPDARIVEQFVLDRLRETFELHGFGSIETRAVEPLDPPAGWPRRDAAPDTYPSGL